MKQKFILIIGVLVIFTGLAIYLWLSKRSLFQLSKIKNFEECVKAGYLILDSYPRKCQTPEGKVFVENIKKDSSLVATPKLPVVKDGCKISGCSGEICSDKELLTNCKWQEEYVCYRFALCERQQDNRCGWTMTDKAKQCLKEAKLKNVSQ